MKIVIVSQFFHPEPSTIPTELARVLAADGHEVHVVTGYPNRPGGRIYAGYRQRMSHRETWEGVAVRRVPLVINHDRSAVRRAMNFLTFAASSLLATTEAKDADAVYVYATPMTAAIAPRLWKSLFKTPYVLHVQDLWPESVTGSGMLGASRVNDAVGKGLGAMLGWLYSGASRVVAIAPTMRQTLEDRGVPADKLRVVLNWADPVTEQAPPADPVAGPTARFVYAGNVGMFQDLDSLVSAARLLSDRGDIRIDVYGDGTELDRLRKESEGLGNIHFHGRVGHEVMARVYDESDYQLVTLKDLPIFRGTIPSKLQGALAAGCPIVTTVSGDVSDIVLDNDLGFTATPEDPADLARVLAEAADTSPSDRARLRGNASRYYRENMSIRAGVSRVLASLTEAAHSGVTRTRRTSTIGASA